MIDPRIDKETREKLAVIDLGFQAQAFLQTPVGKYLRARAEAEIEALTDQLRTMDILADPMAAARVQMDLKRADGVMQWLADIINEGALTTQELIAQERQSDDAPEGDPQP